MVKNILSPTMFKASSRERVPAKIKNKAKDRVKKKFGRIVCEQCGKKPYEVTLEFHHKNMKNSDNKESNIQLLCPTHHRGKHTRARRKVYRDWTGRKYYTRLVKKKSKKKGKKKRKKSTYEKIRIPRFKPPKIEIPKFRL